MIRSMDISIFVVLVGQKVTGTESGEVRYGNYHMSTNIGSPRLLKSPQIYDIHYKSGGTQHDIIIHII